MSEEENRAGKVTRSSPSLGRSTTVMTAGTLLSRISGFGRIMALGYALGQTSVADTYYLANNVPNIIFDLVLGGVLSATLLPVFVSQFTNDDEKESWRAVSSVWTTTLVVLAVLTTLLFALAPWIVDLYSIGNPDPELAIKRAVATDLLRWFAPQIAIYGLISLATGLLQAKRVFGPPMFAPILNNVVVIAMLLMFPTIQRTISLGALQHNTGAIVFLGLGTTLGVVAMAVPLVPSVVRLAGTNLRFVFDFKHAAVKAVIKLSGWTIGFVIANQIALWITITLAYRATSGVSAWNNAYTFFILPHGVFAVSVMSALAPEIAESWIRKNVDATRERAFTGLRMVLTILVPASVGYAILALPIVQVVLARGEFNSTAASYTSSVLFWMVVGLPGFSAFLYLVRVFQAMQLAKTVFWLYLVENGVNVATAFTLYAVAGVKGLAFSLALSYTAGAIVALLVLRQKTNGINGQQLCLAAARISLASFVMGLVVIAIRELLDTSALMEVICSVSAGGFTYLVLATVLGMPEMSFITKRVSRRKSTQ